jgi:fumarate hydratase subunit beta
MAEFRNCRLPMSREEAASLQLGDMVTLDGTIMATAGIPTHKRIVDCIHGREELPVDLANAAFFHLGSFSRDEADEGGSFDVLYMNPTTSTRFNDVMPEIIRHFRLRCVGGKGGLDENCARALGEVGGVYLSFLGGGSPLLSASIRRVVDVAWRDMIPHYRLVTLEVSGLGPLTVGIDSKGNSLYDRLAKQAADRREGILKALGAARSEVPAADPSPRQIDD